MRVVFLLMEMMLCKSDWKYEAVRSARGFLLIGSLLFVFYLFAGKNLGAGDVKLSAVIGAYCGYEQTLWVLFFAALLAAVDGILTRTKTEIPFVPYIFWGTWMIVVLEWLQAL